ncbi:hypothetical protein J9978_05955 [Chromobacterium violaceum]|uniref:hypothetical protein n=1 Tax=Chromobacterium violaceum TaxID=536 RepID=UPI001B33AA9B|nr:hypothetical protein [Chromobacterium violaceum]MBP4049043.1 hypothetical protein [Chromobacterium violaceum]
MKAWKFFINILAALFGLAIFFVIITTFKSAPTAVGGADQTESSAAMVERQASGPIASAQIEVPAAPDHYYEFEENGEYGYAMQLPEGGEKVIPVRYMGIRDGVPVFYWQEGPAQTTLKCKRGCAYATVKAYVNGYPAGESTIKIDSGSAAWKMVQDSQAGRMKPWYSIYQQAAPDNPPPRALPPAVVAAPAGSSSQDSSTPVAAASSPS